MFFFHKGYHLRKRYVHTKRKSGLLEHLGRADQSSPDHNENPVLSKCILVKDTVGIIITTIRVFIVNCEYVPAAVFIFTLSKSVCVIGNPHSTVSNIDAIFEMVPISLKDIEAVSSVAPRSKACI